MKQKTLQRLDEVIDKLSGLSAEQFCLYPMVESFVSTENGKMPTKGCVAGWLPYWFKDEIKYKNRLIKDDCVKYDRKKYHDGVDHFSDFFEIPYHNLEGMLNGGLSILNVRRKENGCMSTGKTYLKIGKKWSSRVSLGHSLNDGVTLVFGPNNGPKANLQDMINLFKFYRELVQEDVLEEFTYKRRSLALLKEEEEALWEKISSLDLSRSTF